jgi:ankyrin repeat protein
LSQEHLHEVKQENKKQDKRYQNNQHRDCHQVFKTSTYEQYKNVNPDRVSGTCQWVLSHPQYLQWYTKARDDLLWISADPGCGKSVLVKSLIENELRNTEEHTICYFFFKDNEEQDNVATALCALLHQLFTHQPQLIQHAAPAWERNGEKLPKEVLELWRILLSAAGDSEAYDVTCVLDALDECRPSHRYWLIDMLARFYTQISPYPSTKPRGRLKFLVTSRPYSDIEIGFQKILEDLPTIRLRGEEENDPIHKEIDLVIRTRVTNLASDLKLDRQTKEQLETKLLKMEHRTYLWLYLAIEDIYQTYPDSIRPEEALFESLPSTVEDAYEKILSRVTERQKGNVKKILQIVVGARRPLNVQEMAIALGIATSTQPKSLDQVKLDPVRLERNIRQWCGLFVFINHARLYLIHQTAKEFLVCDSAFNIFSPKWKHCLNSCMVEKEMTRICVEVLCFEDSRLKAQSLVQKFRRNLNLDDIVDEDNYIESLLVYSAEHWPRHLRDTYMPTNDSFIAQISAFYDIDSGLYDLWFPIFWNATRPYGDRPRMSSIQLAALLGHEKMLDLMLKSNESCDINKSDNTSRTALIWGSEFGHEKVVEMLLDIGADVNAQGGDFGNALQAASGGGHEKIVQMLLDRGADVNAQGGHFSNALQVASIDGHEKVVQMLLDRGADVNTQKGQYGNALQAASNGGHEKVVQMLLDRGADVSAQGGRYGNALLTASNGGHEKVVQMLLDRGADVSAQGGRYGNALLTASGGGHEKIVQMLLDRGADINAQRGDFSNALLTASNGGHEKVVQMLLDRGADVSAQGGRYGNALQAASEVGHEKVVQMLLDKGADVNAQGGDFGNALQAASNGGHEKVVQMLLDKGADVNAQGGFYGNALQAASNGGHEKVVQMLLDRGADVSAQGGDFGNALQAASNGGHEKVVQMLLDRGADVSAQGGDFGNALQAASNGGHEKVVQMLLDRGADVSAQGGRFDNALQAASNGGYEKVVQMLLDRSP